MSVDSLFYHRYDRNTYNCAHFLVDAWKCIVGDDISDKITGFLLPAKERHGGAYLRKHFYPLGKPQSPCIVLMHKTRQAPHVGMFIRGKVIHIQESGVQYMPLDIATFGFDKVRFYACRP